MKAILTVSFICFFSCGLHAQTLPEDPRAASGMFFNAIEKEDGSALNRVLGHDFVLISFDGQAIDAGTLTEGVSGGYVVVENGSTSGNYTRSYSETGVVTGFWNVKGSVQGIPFNNQLAYTVVCAKQGGAWKVVSVQLTPVI